jgi:tetratricopeptide (TPR) repeat protein
MATSDPGPPSAAQPRDAQGYVDRAVERQAQGDLAGAVADCTAALNLDPQAVAAYVVRSLARAGQGYAERAEADFNRALSLHPADAQPYLLRGRFRASLGQLDQALGDFDKALEIEPQNAVAHVRRAQVRAAQGDTAGAVADCDRALALDPHNADAFLTRAAARWARGELGSARADCDEALRLDPADAKAYVLRGNVRQGLGDAAGAGEDFRKAAELDPGLAVPAVGSGDTAGGGALTAPSAEGEPDEGLGPFEEPPAPPASSRGRVIAWVYPGVFHGAVAGAIFGFLKEGVAAALALLVFTPFFFAVWLRPSVRAGQAVLGGLFLAALCIVLFLVRQPDVDWPLAQVSAGPLNVAWWVLAWGVFVGLLFIFGGALHLGLVVAYAQAGVGRALRWARWGSGAGLILGALLAGWFWADVDGGLAGGVVGAVAGLLLGLATGTNRGVFLLGLLGAWLGYQSGQVDLEAVYRVAVAGLGAGVYGALAGGLVGIFAGSSTGSKAPERVMAGPLFRRLVGQVPIPKGQGVAIAAGMMTAVAGLFLGANIGLVSGSVFGGLAVAGTVVGPVADEGLFGWAVGGACLGLVFAFLFTSRRASAEDDVIIPGRVSRGAPLRGRLLLWAVLGGAAAGAALAALVWALDVRTGGVAYWALAGAVAGGMIGARLWSVVEK